MPRKKRTDSTTGAIEAFTAASKDLIPPMALDDAEMVYFKAATRARAREDWTEIDLYHAWNYAKIMHMIALSHIEIATDGMTLENNRGTPVDSPAISRLEKLTRLAMSLSVKLHVHAEATVGKSEDAQKSATNQRQAHQTLKSLDMNDLIALPN